MASTISAGTTTTTALSYSADTSGVLQLQTNGGTTALTLDTSQNATFAGKVASASSLQLATNGTTTAVTIDTSQNLLVGTTSRVNSGAFSFLTNAAGTYTNNGMAIQDSSNGSGFQYLSFNGSTGTQIGSVIRSGTNNAIQIGSSSYLAFAPNSTEAARFDSSGNFLVGATSAANNNIGKTG